jgi:hypothetical protein
MTGSTHEKPLPADNMSDRAPGRSFKSPNGSTWYEVLDRDLGIRLRVAYDTAVPGPAGVRDQVGRVEGGPAKLTCTNLYGSTFAICFSLSEPDWVQLEVYDVMGRRVAVLKEGFAESGPHSVTWEAGAASGTELSPGLYFVRLVTSSEARTAKVVVIE